MDPNAHKKNKIYGRSHKGVILDRDVAVLYRLMRDKEKLFLDEHLFDKMRTAAGLLDMVMEDGANGPRFFKLQKEKPPSVEKLTAFKEEHPDLWEKFNEQK